MSYSLLRAEDAESYAHTEDWGEVSWLAGVEVGNALGVTLGRALMKPGCGDPLHAHDDCEEIIYVVSGTLGCQIGDETVILRKGDTLVVPAGLFHNRKNLGDTPAEVIVVHSSGKSESRRA